LIQGFDLEKLDLALEFAAKVSLNYILWDSQVIEIVLSQLRCVDRRFGR
jgi:hypothetical protein